MNAKLRFKRRDVLKFMAAVPGAAAISFTPAVAQAAVAQAASVSGPTAYQPKILNAHEWKTIRVLCDLIIPADQHSGGAVQAGVPEFIDDWLDFEGRALATQIRGGLAWLDRESSRLFGSDFVDCSSEQQTQLLDRIAYPKKAAPEDASAVVFFNHLRDLVVAGFFTSEAGIRDLPYLGNEPRSEWNGCPPEALTKLGISKDQSSG